MAPSTLHGLNIVHPDSSTTHNAHNNGLLSDSDLLSASGHYPPELAAQLDLWTTLSFSQDDSPSSRPRGNSTSSSLKRSLEEDEEDEDEEAPAGPAQPDGHENVVTITHSAAPSDLHHLPPPSHHGDGHPAPGQLDLNTFLASLGMSQHVSLPLEPTSSGPSLASILSLYQNQASSLSPPPVPAPAPTPATARSSSVSASARPTKKARKSSASASSPITATPASAASTTKADAEADEEEEELLAGMTPTEDKRRRNTAASARFRAKKKEREQALERKAKDLDGRVSELERECEALRRENGWLRGLVVGATGAAGAPLIPGLNFAGPVGGGKRD